MGWSPGTECRTQLSRPPPSLRALLPGPQQPLGPAWHPAEPPTISRDTTVLLALLLRVELVAVTLAAPIGEKDALPLYSIKCPELDGTLTGTVDYGEIAGRCGVEGRHTALVILMMG